MTPSKKLFCELFALKYHAQEIQTGGKIQTFEAKGFGSNFSTKTHSTQSYFVFIISRISRLDSAFFASHTLIMGKSKTGGDRRERGGYMTYAIRGVGEGLKSGEIKRKEHRVMSKSGTASATGREGAIYSWYSQAPDESYTPSLTPLPPTNFRFD